MLVMSDHEGDPDGRGARWIDPSLPFRISAMVGSSGGCPAAGGPGPPPGSVAPASPSAARGRRVEGAFVRAGPMWVVVPRGAVIVHGPAVGYLTPLLIARSYAYAGWAWRGPALRLFPMTTEPWS